MQVDVYLNQKIAAAIPSYKEEKQINRVWKQCPTMSTLLSLLTMQAQSPIALCEIVKEMMKEDSRILLVAREENGGVGAAIEDITEKNPLSMEQMS